MGSSILKFAIIFHILVTMAWGWTGNGTNESENEYPELTDDPESPDTSTFNPVSTASYYVQNSLYTPLGYDIPLAFGYYTINTFGGLCVSILIIYFAAIFLELIKCYRSYINRYVMTKLFEEAYNQGGMDEQVRALYLEALHKWNTYIHVIQLLFSYTLLIIFLSFNLWLCAAMILGSASGYFFFSRTEGYIFSSHIFFENMSILFPSDTHS